MSRKSGLIRSAGREHGTISGGQRPGHAGPDSEEPESEVRGTHEGCSEEGEETEQTDGRMEGLSGK